MPDVLTIQEARTREETLERMRERLSRLVPEVELRIKADLAFEINQLKRERNAVILGHNYMEPALFHSVTDYRGDSLELSRISATTEADIIVFCGVQFMAETAKILNPSRTVLIPSEKAGCSLAQGITAEDVRRLKAIYPGAPVVTYVNTYAEVKAESDYCCTSGNAEAMMDHLLASGHDHVLFLPDEYLATNVAAEMGLPIVIVRDLEHPPEPPARGVIGWRARCEVHEQFTVDDIRNVRKQFPEVVILTHPEASRAVVEASDFSGSTKQMIHYVRDKDAPQYLLLTECSMGDNIAAENPHREMLRLCSVRCPHMNQITLEDTLEALRKTQYEIHLPEDLMRRARTALDRMLEIG